MTIVILGGGSPEGWPWFGLTLATNGVQPTSSHTWGATHVSIRLYFGAPKYMVAKPSFSGHRTSSVRVCFLCQVPAAFKTAVFRHKTSRSVGRWCGQLFGLRGSCLFNLPGLQVSQNWANVQEGSAMESGNCGVFYIMPCCTEIFLKLVGDPVSIYPVR